MAIGKGQGEFAVATPLIQTVKIAFHPEVPGLAKVYKSRFGAFEAFGTGHAADYLLDPLALIFSHSSHHHRLNRGGLQTSSNPERRAVGQGVTIRGKKGERKPSPYSITLIKGSGPQYPAAMPGIRSVRLSLLRILRAPPPNPTCPGTGRRHFGRQMRRSGQQLRIAGSISIRPSPYPLMISTTMSPKALVERILSGA